MTRVFQTLAMGDAHVRAALVRDPGQADLLVHRVGSRGLAAHGALWYITRVRADAELRVHFCSLGMAQLRICFVGSFGQAGWVTRDHPARKLLDHAPERVHSVGLAAAGAAAPGAGAGGAGGGGSSSVGR